MLTSKPEPLSASSLSQLLGIPPTSITRTLNRLHAVLDIPRETDSPIRPFHLSFRDFLVDPAKQGINEFWIDDRKVHKSLATICIQRLGSSLRREICNLKRPGKARIEVDTKDIDTCLPAYIQYVCRYWVSHLEQGKERIRDGGQVHEFFKCHFLHWLEAPSLMGTISEAVATIRTLRILAEVRNLKKLYFATLTSSQPHNAEVWHSILSAPVLVLKEK